MSTDAPEFAISRTRRLMHRPPVAVGAERRFILFAKVHMGKATLSRQ
jgi:hypothetical protein